MSKIVDSDIFTSESKETKFLDLSGKEHIVDFTKISFRAGITIAEKYPRIIELSQENIKGEKTPNNGELYKIMSEVFSSICIGQDKTITVDFIYDNMEFTLVSVLLKDCMESVRGFLSKQMGVVGAKQEDQEQSA